MARLVLVVGDALHGLPELPVEGLDLTLGPTGVQCGPTGSVPAPRLRVRLEAEGRAVSVVRLAGAPPLVVDRKPVEGARLASGQVFEAGPLRCWLWAPADAERAPAANISEDDLRTLFRLTGELDLVHLDQLLARMMDRLMEVFDAERGFILLRNRRSGKYEQAIARRIPLSEMGHAASRTVVQRVLQERKPVTLGDAGAVLGHAASVQAEGIRSVIAAPLLRGGEPLGVVYLDSRAVHKVFSQRELGLIDAFARHVSEAIAAALECDGLRRDVEFLRAVSASEVRRDYDPRAMVGASAAAAEIQRQVADVAVQDVTTLIQGESGTGKELVARAIHETSPRRQGPFVAVNCMALAREVVESELFGHEKGAFTGALERRPGRFELASGGTLFLDELGELSPDVQVKLLRVLEERQVERVGGHAPLDVDVRVVAATNKDLRTLVREGLFREDLYYRVAVFTIALPSLRERPDDVEPLVQHFVARCNERMGRSLRGPSRPALQALRTYAWPGNVRELRNVIERAFILEKGPEISLESLPADVRGGAPSLRGAEPSSGPAAGWRPGQTLAAAREAFELDVMQLSLKRHGGNVAKAASELGIPRSTLYRKFQASGLELKKAAD